MGGAGKDTISGGSGNDRIDVRDSNRDVVTCGPGKDFVRADPMDKADKRSCEKIIRQAG